MQNFWLLGVEHLTFLCQCDQINSRFYIEFYSQVMQKLLMIIILYNNLIII